jgi:hypothetical protein
LWTPAILQLKDAAREASVQLPPPQNAVLTNDYDVGGHSVDAGANFGGWNIQLGGTMMNLKISLAALAAALLAAPAASRYHSEF